MPTTTCPHCSKTFSHPGKPAAVKALIVHIRTIHPEHYKPPTPEEKQATRRKWQQRYNRRKAKEMGLTVQKYYQFKAQETKRRKAAAAEQPAPIVPIPPGRRGRKPGSKNKVHPALEAAATAALHTSSGFQVCPRCNLSYNDLMLAFAMLPIIQQRNNQQG